MEPTEVVHRAYEAFAAGDLEAMLEISAPGVVLTQDDALPWGGRYVGGEGVADFFLRLVGTIDSQVIPETIFAAGQTVIQHGRTRGTVRETGAAFDIPECHVFRIEDGKIAGVDFYIDSDAMLEALGR
jgi:ketosteroid isomerase-like protein